MLSSISKSLLTAGSLMLGSLLLTPSCADNNSSLFIVGVLDTGLTTCIAKPDNTGPFLASGTLDTAFASGYTAVVLVGNQLTQQGSREQLRTETSRVSLRGAEVRLSTLNGMSIAGAQGAFSTVGTGFVDPAAGDTPSYATMAVNLIPPGLTGLPPQVLAKIRVFGDTLGGTSVTSSELDFPITVCNGCLIMYDTPDTTQAAGAPFMCATSTASSTQTTAVAPCILGQDQQFSCTLCSAAYDVCRDPCKNMTYASSSTCMP
ncbi:MAG TPA: hypothetical protein VNW92_12420 [Polyangiaceae bacterium]|jgi:hypothetical protein|nr:hypothetical protein [Polyangiaceae bacterium]